MKTKKIITEKGVDTVKAFRVIKEKISKDIADMSLPQLKNYLEKKRIRSKK